MTTTEMERYNLVLPNHEVADKLGVSQQSVAARLRHGTLPYVMVPGFGRRVYRPALDDLMDKEENLKAVGKKIMEAAGDLIAEHDKLEEDIHASKRKDWTDEWLSAAVRVPETSQNGNHDTSNMETSIT